MKPETSCEKYSGYKPRTTPIKLVIEFTEDNDGRWDKILDVLERPLHLGTVKDSGIDLAAKERGVPPPQD